MRSETDIIDNAIKENRLAEVILYGFATVVVLAGSFVLVYAVVTAQAITAVAGAISNSLFIPAMIFAAKIRKQNIAIRLLEAPLTRADTAREAAEAIKQFFLITNVNDESLSARKTGKET